MNSTPFQLTQMFSDLTGRRVSVAESSSAAKSTAKKALAVYKVVENESTILARMDLPVLATLGGILVGLPEAVVKQQVNASDISETLFDAMHEILNITAAALSTRRAVLQSVITNAAEADAAIRDFSAESFRTQRYEVTAGASLSGQLDVLVPLW